MSTQSSIFAPFSILSPPEHVRLLELPPELLAVIEDKSSARVLHTTKPVTDIYNAHFDGRIQLKSAPTNDSATSTKPKEQYLHLCTESHVWVVRQVSTSNSVYIFSPSAASASTTSIDDPSASRVGLTAFAQPNSTLELLPSPFSPSDIDAAIHRLLPTHPAPPSPGSRYNDITTSSLTEAELTTSLPYPHLPVAEAKRRNFVFTGPDNKAYMPSPELLLTAWRTFVQYANTQSFDISDRDVLALPEISGLIAQDEGTLLPAVMQAVARVFVDDEKDLKEAAGEYWEIGRAVGSLEGEWKGAEVTRWVGGLLVRCAESEKMEQHLLIEKWQDLVPSQWWKWCKVEELGEGNEAEGSWVKWKGVGQRQQGPQTANETAKSAAPASTAAGKRNWHEKFAAQRKRILMTAG